MDMLTKDWKESFVSFSAYLAYRFMYWSLLFIPLFIALWQKWITTKTKIPEGINAFVTDETSLWLFFAIFLATFILAGIACLFSSKKDSFMRKVMDLALDDMAKILVELSVIWFWMIGLVVIFIGHQNLMVMFLGVVELFAFSFFGWRSFFKIKVAHTQPTNQENKE